MRIYRKNNFTEINCIIDGYCEQKTGHIFTPFQKISQFWNCVTMFGITMRSAFKYKYRVFQKSHPLVDALYLQILK